MPRVHGAVAYALAAACEDAGVAGLALAGFLDHTPVARLRHPAGAHEEEEPDQGAHPSRKRSLHRRPNGEGP